MQQAWRLAVRPTVFLTAFIGLFVTACFSSGGGPLQLETVLDTGAVFDRNVPQASIAVGDVTNDGRQDLVIATCCESRAAVFQRDGEGWDDGTLLDGPSVTVAARPIIAPIRNDGQNWLVYTEHLGGNNGQWLRAHRYEGTMLVENQDVATRVDWPGHHAATVADLDGDGALEIWYVELYGPQPNPTMHLLRRAWDPATATYAGGEVADGGIVADVKIRPRAGDFLGDGNTSLVWASGPSRLELASYTPGAGVMDHTSSIVHDASGLIVDFYSGEIDEEFGTDIVVGAWDGENGVGRVMLISGGSFSITELGRMAEQPRLVRSGDLKGDGTDEVYVVGSGGTIFGYDEGDGWRELAAYP
jgi:hypothetical protein